jgi:probable phosphoglycerate mutase
VIDPEIEFFLIRHGETAWNREGRLQGQQDIPLNPLGRDQAAAAGRSLKLLLKQRGITDPSTLDFVASPLGRTRETMELVRGAMGLPPSIYRIDATLKELSFGAWEGLTWPEVKAIAPSQLKERKRHKWGFVPPDGESYRLLGDRLRPWLGTVKHHDVVVAHGGVARALMHLIAGASTEDAVDADIWQGRVLSFNRKRCHWH